MEDASKKQFARLITRRGSHFPFRNARFFDCTPWGGGYVRYDGAPGGVILDRAKGLVLNLRSGEVTTDARLVEGGSTALLHEFLK